MKSDESRRIPEAEKTGVKVVPVIDNTELIEAAKTVACVDVLEAPPENGKAFAGPFYPDEGEVLCKLLRGLRGRELFAVAPGDGGLMYVYRKPKQ